MHLLRSRPLASVVALGAMLVLIGGAWLVGSDFGAVGPPTFGWFEYAPESDVTFSDGVVAMSTSGRNALVLLGLGALLLSAAGGYVLGRRRTAEPTPGTGSEND